MVAEPNPLQTLLRSQRLQPDQIIYGAILALSVLIALDFTDASPLRVISVMLVTMIAGTVAHCYAHVIGHELEHGRLSERQEYLATLRSIAQALLPATPVVVVFLLAAASLIEIYTAFTVGQGLLCALLFATGFYLRRGNGGSLLRSLGDGLFDLGLGLLIVAVKFLAH
jgi:hypothetical protein